jgi:hypothetical protein
VRAYRGACTEHDLLGDQDVVIGQAAHLVHSAEAAPANHLQPLEAVLFHYSISYPDRRLCFYFVINIGFMASECPE